ncbi:hypothetical protein EMPG_09367 [Blastomyces silverae]|uniref:Uncharacterized protein n=1 Tax=Blastomyces silverae TaxID=2060906 RepID=A0A0H1B2Q0_9EURO|nr:hypothetical protein EMPG_09367 [Blastomyces silverae]
MDSSSPAKVPSPFAGHAESGLLSLGFCSVSAPRFVGFDLAQRALLQLQPTAGAAVQIVPALMIPLSSAVPPLGPNASLGLLDAMST